MPSELSTVSKTFIDACGGGVQDCIMSGLPLEVPQLFESAQARVCCELGQALQSLHCQSGVQEQGWVEFGSPLLFPHLFESLQVRVCREFEQALQLLHTQFGLHAIVQPCDSAGLFVNTPQLFLSVQARFC